MEPINWCVDIPAEYVISSLGLKYKIEKVAISAIDFAASARNFARDDARIDLSHVEGIAAARKAGKPIPYVVLRVFPGGRYVIAGGNHRCKAFKDCGDIEVFAYTVDCTNAEYSILCKALNAPVGKGTDRPLRIKQAMQAVTDGSLAATEAAKVFNVSTTAIHNEIRSQRGKLKVEAVACGKVRVVPKAILDALAGVTSDSIVIATIDALANGANAKELAMHVRNASAAASESDAVAEINKASMAATTTKVTSKKKADFLRPLTSIENVILKYSATSLEGLDIETAHIEEVRKRCKKLANTLNSL
jgi:hypothetical protein